MKFKMRAVFSNTSNSTGFKFIQAADGPQAGSAIVGPFSLIWLEEQGKFRGRGTIPGTRKVLRSKILLGRWANERRRTRHAIFILLFLESPSMPQNYTTVFLLLTFFCLTLPLESKLHENRRFPMVTILFLVYKTVPGTFVFSEWMNEWMLVILLSLGLSAVLWSE